MPGGLQHSAELVRWPGSAVAPSHSVAGDSGPGRAALHTQGGSGRSRVGGPVGATGWPRRGTLGPPAAPDGPDRDVMACVPATGAVLDPVRPRHSEFRGQLT